MLTRRQLLQQGTRLPLLGLAPAVLNRRVLAAEKDSVKAPGPPPAAEEKDTRVWKDALELGVEGQGWPDSSEPYTRLPDRAKNDVSEMIWNLSRHSSGLHVRFVTNSPSISARWTVRSSWMSSPIMCGVAFSGLDLYAKGSAGWGWVGSGQPAQVENNVSKLLSDAPPGPHEYMLYLPLTNGIVSLQIGLEPGAELAAAPPYPPERAKPLVFWGTSIVQGGCATRPGMPYLSILARRLDRPFINLGFSASGRMDPAVAALVAELDAAAYVVDCLPNMDAGLVQERTAPMVRTLKRARPETPILLVGDMPAQQAWFVEEHRKGQEHKDAVLAQICQDLLSEGVTRLHFVPVAGFLSRDHENTVDGIHPTDLGFMRIADGLEAPLRAALGS